MYILVHVCIYSCMYELVYVPMVLICDESKVGASSRRWELRVEGKARSRPSSRRSSFESKVRASFKLEVAGGPVESVESKVFGASSRRWELRVEGGTFESKVGPQGWVQFTPRAHAPRNTQAFPESALAGLGSHIRDSKRTKTN